MVATSWVGGEKARAWRSSARCRPSAAAVLNVSAARKRAVPPRSDAIRPALRRELAPQPALAPALAPDSPRSPEERPHQRCPGVLPGYSDVACPTPPPVI